MWGHKGQVKGQIFQKCSDCAQIYMEWSLWHSKHIENKMEVIGQMVKVI